MSESEKRGGGEPAIHPTGHPSMEQKWEACVLRPMLCLSRSQHPRGWRYSPRLQIRRLSPWEVGPQAKDTQLAKTELIGTWFSPLHPPCDTRRWGSPLGEPDSLGCTDRRGARPTTGGAGWARCPPCPGGHSQETHRGDTGGKPHFSVTQMSAPAICHSGLALSPSGLAGRWGWGSSRMGNGGSRTSKPLSSAHLQSGSMKTSSNVWKERN